MEMDEGDSTAERKAAGKDESRENRGSRARAVISTVLCVVFLLLAITCTVTIFASKATGNPQLFGYTLMSVQSDSMEPEILVGDLIIGKSVTTDTVHDIVEGDIISFYMIEQSTGAMITNTHKVISLKELTGGAVIFTTHGVNPNIPDDAVEEVWSNDVISVYTGTRLKGMGKVMDFLQQPLGFGLCVLLPVAVFFLFCLIDFIKKFSNYKAEVATEKAAEAVEKAKEADLSDEAKKRIAEEYLAKLNADTASADKAPTENACENKCQPEKDDSESE